MWPSKRDLVLICARWCKASVYMAVTIVRTNSGLRTWVSARRARTESVALVPTMGALHEGHLSLVRLAKARAKWVVASLFVNPAQFGPGEDFAAYPRDEDRDADMLSTNGCDLLFVPGGEEIYPPGFSTTITVGGPSAPLEGEFRPGHFAGVATVVAKLLILCQPDVAVFGEKDYQQLQVIRGLVRDLALPVEVVGGPIVRDQDGLALSSRNAYLTGAERAVAPALYRALKEAGERLASGRAVSQVEAEGRAGLLAAGFHTVDYFEVRGAEDLRRLGAGPVNEPARILAAAKLGRTRLIDNLAA
jgi:pantoate--beta-alanine ligase